MVFGFFTKKPPPPPPEFVPLPPSPSLEPEEDIDTPQPGPSASEVQLQLRTPSPSIEETPGYATSSVPFLSSLFGFGPAHQPTSEFISGQEITTPSVESLTSQLTSIPPKTLHSYVLTQLPRASDETISSLHTFFADLTPPPRLHCVRCHNDYVDVENTDRSCLVPHDDESAMVERVGTAAKRGKTDVGATYETMWGCCAKTVEGDGDQGPPDGWCYEGMHTTDVKRARFRADSTVQDDKLTSCLKLNCHGVRDQLPRTSTRTRKRPRSATLKEPDTDQEGSAMDVDGAESASAKSRSSARGRRSVKSSPNTKVTGASAVGKKSGLRATIKDTDDEATSVKSAPTATGKRRGRPPKNRTAAAETASEAGEGRNGGHRTRSVSRTRMATKNAADSGSAKKRRKVVD